VVAVPVVVVVLLVVVLVRAAAAVAGVLVAMVVLVLGGVVVVVRLGGVVVLVFLALPGQLRAQRRQVRLEEGELLRLKQLRLRLQDADEFLELLNLCAARKIGGGASAADGCGGHAVGRERTHLLRVDGHL